MTKQSQWKIWLPKILELLPPGESIKSLKDDTGDTLLHVAAKKGAPTLVKHLVS
jgi:ankyrin repeat protein